ncbi:acyltransferase family protein [Flavobacterium sp. WC2509]|uniref:acyltransferase family protein n=1 Tax=Flavobacterium sp. WC2509 TaxID=3461406 RepID=UPI004043A610
MKEHIEYIDFQKGICILLVVFGHLLQANTTESCHHPIFSFVYSFHMPLFMFVSGYIGYKTYNVNNIWEAISGLVKKTRSLLLPYFIWPLIVYNLFLVNEYDFNIWTQFIDLLTRWSPLWFLWDLFLFYVLYTIFLLIYINVKLKKTIFIDFFAFFLFISMLLALRYFQLPFLTDLDSYILYCLFFFGGMFVSKYTLISKLILNKSVFFISFTLFLVMVGNYDFFDLGMKNKLIKIIISISAIILIYNLSRLYTENSILQCRLKHYGRHSLVIYVTHFSMWTLLANTAIFSNLSNLYTIIVIVAMSLVLIETCILIKKIVTFSPYLDFILYGEKIKKTNSKL